jgi:hypothetical protein
MRIVIIAVVASLLGTAGARAATRGASAETTSATSLLTAEHRARDAAERLRLPEAGPARWKRGGEGWMPAWSAEKRSPNDRRKTD